MYIKAKIDPFAISSTNYMGEMIRMLNKTGPIEEAYIGTTTYIDVFINNVYALGKEAYCEVDIQIVEDLPRTLSGHMFPYNSMLQPLFDRYMHNLYQDGILNQIEERHAPQFSKQCTNDQNLREVNLDYVQILFICLGTGGIMSIAILMIEKLLKKA